MSSVVCVLLFYFFQEFHRLQDENIQLKTICEDQEQALEELGSKLSEYVGNVCTKTINTQFSFGSISVVGRFWMKKTAL